MAIAEIIATIKGIRISEKISLFVGIAFLILGIYGLTTSPQNKTIFFILVGIGILCLMYVLQVELMFLAIAKLGKMLTNLLLVLINSLLAIIIWIFGLIFSIFGVKLKKIKLK